jgi:RNA polymerase primary sigma factor
MAQIRCQPLSDLLMQTKFAPEKQRLIQLDACETLLRLISPGKEYPWEFVCFHLTGYRPRSQEANYRKLLNYKDLQHDLPIYTEELSRTSKIPVSSFKGQKFYTIEALIQRYNVCEKTISRWRRNGLAGRFLLYPDGKYRLSFPASGVKFFVQRHKRRIQRSKQFSHLDTAERQAIIRRLDRIARFCPDRRQEAITRTARKFNRSGETVRTILKDYERNVTRYKLFHKRTDNINTEKARDICTLYEQGAPVKILMRQFGRSKSNIYRILCLHWAGELEKIKIAFIPAEDFSHPFAEQNILGEPPGLFDANDPSAFSALAQDKKNLREDKTKSHLSRTPLQNYWNDIRSTDLLSQRQEEFLFRKYNYLKYLVATRQKDLNLKYPQGKLVRQLRRYLQEANQIKEKLIRCNLRLVVSAARKHTRNDALMLEMISEGNIALMNAVEKFDFSRGYKFSTYATWAVVKRFASYHSQKQKRRADTVSDEYLEVAQDLRLQENQVAAVESARQSLQNVMSETLEERERVIVQEHYGLAQAEKVIGQRKAKSLSQIADLIGLSKERVRQIELLALQKLRKVLSPEQFDLLTQY